MMGCVCVCVCFILICIYYCLQYFLPFAKDGINKQIELAILRADKMGVKVLSLAALNKVNQRSLNQNQLAERGLPI